MLVSHLGKRLLTVRLASLARPAPPPERLRRSQADTICGRSGKAKTRSESAKSESDRSPTRSSLCRSPTRASLRAL
eukprot:4857453-Prymnesium_polylepis.1